MHALMAPIRRQLRSSQVIYTLHHRIVMKCRCWWLGLKTVDPTFYMARRSSVSRDLVAGAHSYIGPECIVGPNVRIGAYVMLGPRVAIIGGDHQFNDPGVPMCFSKRTVP